MRRPGARAIRRSGGRDESAHIDVAGGNDAVEGCGHAFVTLQSDGAAEVGLEGFDVAFGGGYVGDLALVVGLALVAVLFGEDSFCNQHAVALHCNGGEGELGLLLGYLGLCLRDLFAGLIDLLIQVRGVDDGEKLAFANAIADVYEATGYIAVRDGRRRRPR